MGFPRSFMRTNVNNADDTSIRSVLWKGVKYDFISNVIDVFPIFSGIQ